MHVHRACAHWVRVSGMVDEEENTWAGDQLRLSATLRSSVISSVTLESLQSSKPRFSSRKIRMVVIPTPFCLLCGLKLIYDKDQPRVLPTVNLNSPGSQCVLLFPSHNFLSQLHAPQANKESPWLLPWSTTVDILPLDTGAGKQFWIPAISIKIFPNLWSDVSPPCTELEEKDSIKCH